jgi:hypothetical protein
MDIALIKTKEKGGATRKSKKMEGKREKYKYRSKEV